MILPHNLPPPLSLKESVAFLPQPYIHTYIALNLRLTVCPSYITSSSEKRERANHFPWYTCTNDLHTHLSCYYDEGRKEGRKEICISYVSCQFQIITDKIIEMGDCIFRWKFIVQLRTQATHSLGERGTTEIIVNSSPFTQKVDDHDHANKLGWLQYSTRHHNSSPTVAVQIAFRTYINVRYS